MLYKSMGSYEHSLENDDMNPLQKTVNVFDRIIGGLAVLAAAFILFIMVSILYEVVIRYFLGQASIWVVELTGYSLAILTFLGTAWVLKKEGHVTIDLVLIRLSPESRSIVNVVTSILSAVVCLIIVWYSIKAAIQAFQIDYRSALELEFPWWILLSFIPVGTFLLSVQFLRRAYANLEQYRGSKKSQG